MELTEPPSGDDASRVRRQGWRQGSIVGSDCLEALDREGIPRPSPDCLAIVLSHDCDVASSSFEKEPLVELAWLSPIDGPDGRMTLGKNARCLHIELQKVSSTEASWFEVSASARLSVSRRILAGYVPAAEWSLNQGSKQLVGKWAARRYDRSAFPDEFNSRLPKSKRLTRALEAESTWIEALYIHVSDDELAPEQPYDVHLRAVMSVVNFADPEKRAQADRCLQELAGLLDDSPGINVGEAEVVSESEFTLDDLRWMKRWGDFDWLSAPGGLD